MSNRTTTIVLAVTLIGLVLVLVPVVLHSGFGIEVWPLTRLSSSPTPAEFD